MSIQPVILVAGLGRCGTTMTMHMLAAAGVPCVGGAPSYEVEEVNHHTPDAAWLAAQGGKALKLLDPHHCRPLPRLPALVVWLDRDAMEQARSQAKFAHLVAGFPRANRGQVRRMADGLRNERHLGVMAVASHLQLRLTFEGVLADPMLAALRIAGFLRPEFGELDATAMARVVRPRSPACAPDLAMEIAMLEAAHV